MRHEDLWISRELSRFELAWAMSTSLVYHVLALVILTGSTAPPPPVAGTDAGFDVLWATPASLPPARSGTIALLPATGTGRTTSSAPLEPTASNSVPEEMQMPGIPQVRPGSGETDLIFLARENTRPHSVTPLGNQAQSPVVHPAKKSPAVDLAPDAKAASPARIGDADPVAVYPEPALVRHAAVYPEPDAIRHALAASSVAAVAPPAPVELPVSPPKSLDGKQPVVEVEPAPLHPEEKHPQQPPAGSKPAEPERTEESLVLVQIELSRKEPSTLSARVPAPPRQTAQDPRPAGRQPPRSPLGAAKQAAQAVHSTGPSRSALPEERSAPDPAPSAARPLRPGKRPSPALQSLPAALAANPAAVGKAALAQPNTQGDWPRKHAALRRTTAASSEVRSSPAYLKAKSSGGASEPAAPAKENLRMAAASDPAGATMPAARESYARRGPVQPAPRGDLKLVLTGEPGVRITVRFRDYPGSRPTRQSPRSQAAREQQVEPLLTVTGATTREALIPSAREGVYTVSVEPEGCNRATTSGTLILYEGSSRERTVPLQPRSVTATQQLFKVLMPEAVLWDDPAAFTGTLEDSDSETRFNATSGLYWKEFHD
jgi:hypothetical protein